MKRLKLSFVAMHPGSVNALTPLVIKCIELGHEVHLIPMSKYACVNWEADFSYPDNEQTVELIPPDSDYLFYSPAIGIRVETLLPGYCRNNSIKSIAVLDIFWSFKSDLKARFLDCPDIIITPESTSAQDLISLGIKSKVLPLGNPWFEVNYYKAIPTVINTFAYISFPVGNDNQCDTDKRSIEIIKKLLSTSNNYKSVKEIIICPHPRECLAGLTKLIESTPSSLTVRLNTEMTTTQVCSLVDAVVGTNSTILIEEYLKGHNVIFHESIDETVKLLERYNELSCDSLELSLPKNSVSAILNLITGEL